MAFREVAVTEIREVLRAWLAGDGLRKVAAQAGVDRKTARRYASRVTRSALVGDLARLGLAPIERMAREWLLAPALSGVVGTAAAAHGGFVQDVTFRCSGARGYTGTVRFLTGVNCRHRPPGAVFSVLRCLRPAPGPPGTHPGRAGRGRGCSPSAGSRGGRRRASGACGSGCLRPAPGPPGTRPRARRS